MAWLERKTPTSPFRVVFRVGDQTLKRSLRTCHEGQAKARLSCVEETLHLIETGRIDVPANTDVATFVLLGGKAPRPAKKPSALSVLALEKRFRAAIPRGHMEDNSLATMATHLKHVRRILGDHRQIESITTETLQEYVTRRAQETNRHGRHVSATTIKKELASFRAM